MRGKKFDGEWGGTKGGTGGTGDGKQSKDIVCVSGLSKRYGDNLVLDNVNFTVRRGTVCVIIGPSGGGKSTLLRCVNGLAWPTAGNVVIDGVAITNRNIGHIRRSVGLVFQNFNLFPHLTAMANIMLAPRVTQRRPKSEVELQARELLDMVGLPDKSDAFPDQLSGGQQQRVAIARALAVNPSLLLFDEPTSALDPEMIGEVLDVMMRLVKEHMTMIVVSHEMGFVKKAADDVILLDNGRIVERGTPQRIFNAPRHERTRDFLEKIL